MKTKLLALVLGATLAVSALTGCGQFDGSRVVARVGEEEITADVLNFYSRFEQAQYETYYASMMGEGMWDQATDPGKTYEDSVKESLVDAITGLYVLEQHKEEYNVEITDADRKMIDKKAKEFIKENDKETLEAISGDEETVKEVLELLAVQEKMYQAMTADVNVDITDEEAAQKSLQYVFFPLTKTDENGQQIPMSDEEKAEKKKEAEAFYAEAVKAKDLEAFGKEKDRKVSVLTFDKNTLAPSEKLVKEADKVKAGEMVPFIEEETGYYVARLTSELDREATDGKKYQMAAERKQERYASLSKEWNDKAEVKVEKGIWDHISFKEQGVVIKQVEKDTEK